MNNASKDLLTLTMELEDCVDERTPELKESNINFQEEIVERKTAE